MTCSSAAAQNGLFTQLSAQNGLVVRQLVDSRPQAMPQSETAKTGNYSVAGNAPMPLANSASGDNSSNGLQQIAPQAPAGANQMQNETISQSASRAASQSNFTQRRGAAPTASNGSLNFNGGNSIQAGGGGGPYQNRFGAQDTAQSAITSNFNLMPDNGSAAWYYYECEATPDQLNRLLSQLHDRRDEFALTEHGQSHNTVLATGSRSPGGEQAHGPNWYGYKAAENGATQTAAAKGGAEQRQLEAEAGQAGSDYGRATQRRFGGGMGGKSGRAEGPSGRSTG